MIANQDAYKLFGAICREAARMTGDMFDVHLIGDDIGLSPSSRRQALADLEAAGLIEWVRDRFVRLTIQGRNACGSRSPKPDDAWN
jgi:DNA-binding MarR family transcriptional regulator